MNRIEKEKHTVGLMIAFYCRKKHKAVALCIDCRELLEYAEKKLDACRYGESKAACKMCPTHCYASAYLERIRTVMRFSGPRMILYHPKIAFNHYSQSILSSSPK